MEALRKEVSVQPPPNAAGTIRLEDFEGVDLQLCSGTHVASTTEIGAVEIQNSENQGMKNRRIMMVFDE